MIIKSELIDKPCSQAEYPYEHRVLSKDELDQVSGGHPVLVLGLVVAMCITSYRLREYIESL